MTAKAQKAFLLTFFSLTLAWGVFAAGLRTWTFRDDGQMKTSSGGNVSFKKKGRLDAAFVRTEGTNIVLLAHHGEYLTIALTNLCDADQVYLSRASGVTQSEANWVGQNAIVRNEMARRRIESAKLSEEAVARRRLADLELEAADKLDADAASLAGRATNLQFQAQCHQEMADTLTNTFSPSPVVGAFAIKTGGAAGIVSGAADQLQQDVARLRRQAQEKRTKAANLQRDAARLEQNAALEANSLARPQ